jgi:hypothetical protein
MVYRASALEEMLDYQAMLPARIAISTPQHAANSMYVTIMRPKDESFGTGTLLLRQRLQSETSVKGIPCSQYWSIDSTTTRSSIEPQQWRNRSTDRLVLLS